MADHIDNGLAAVIKALDDVVAKAIDPSNPLAREQLKLATRYLGFLRQRLPHRHERERFELTHYNQLARELLPMAALCAVPDAPSVAAAIQTGQSALDNASATSADIQAAIDTLTTAVSVLVRAASVAQPQVRRQIELLVTLASAKLFDVQRAWYMPMGFEPDPSRVPALDRALAR
jgi:hypothetical protein